MAQPRSPVKSPGGARFPLPADPTPQVLGLVVEARALGQRIASGERGSQIETEIEAWYRAWQLATGQPVTDRLRT